MKEIRNTEKYEYSNGGSGAPKTKDSEAIFNFLNKKTQALYITSVSGFSLPLNNILLPAGSKYRTKPQDAGAMSVSKKLASNWEKINWLVYLIGGVWQKALKSERNLRKFLCPTCHGTSIVFFGNELSIKNFIDQLADLIGRGDQQVSEVVKKQTITYSLAEYLEKYIGGSDQAALEKFAKEIESVLTYEGKFQFAIDMLDENTKDLKRAWDDGGITEVISWNRWEKLRPRFKRLQKSLNVNGQQVFEACPMCRGSGILDLGHASIYGKKVDIIRDLYIDYIIKDKGKVAEKLRGVDGKDPEPSDIYEAKWNQEIPIEKVYEYFQGMELKPEPAKSVLKKNITERMSKDFPKYLQFIKDYKENQEPVWTQLSQLGVTQLQYYFDGLRENPEFELVYYNKNLDDATGIITFKRVLNLFNKLSDTARVDTGTLKNYLETEKTDIAKEAVKFAPLIGEEGTTNAPYIGPHVVIDSPNVMQRAGKIQKSGYKAPNVHTFFKYARLFAPQDKKLFPYGLGKDTWSDSGKTITDIGREAFPEISPDRNGTMFDYLLKKKFFIFFWQGHDV